MGWETLVSLTGGVEKAGAYLYKTTVSYDGGEIKINRDYVTSVKTEFLEAPQFENSDYLYRFEIITTGGDSVISFGDSIFQGKYKFLHEGSLPRFKIIPGSGVGNVTLNLQKIRKSHVQMIKIAVPDKSEKVKDRFGNQGYTLSMGWQAVLYRDIKTQVVDLLLENQVSTMYHSSDFSTVTAKAFHLGYLAVNGVQLINDNTRYYVVGPSEEFVPATGKVQDLYFPDIPYNPPLNIDFAYYLYQGSYSEPYYPENSASRFSRITLNAKFNSNPTILLHQGSKDLDIIYEKETLTFSGQATDLDVGDTVIVKYRIDNYTVKTIKAEVSQGVAIDYQKSLVFKGGQLYDGTTAVSRTLKEGVTYTVEVWTEDEHGGKSTVEKVPFTVVPNRPPVLAITTIPTLDKQLLVDIAKIEGTAIDPDENTMTLQAQINTQVVKTIPIKDGAWSFSFALKELKEGTNYIIFTLTDQYDAIHRKQVRLTLQPSHTPTAHKAVRMAVGAPEPVDTIIMWIKRGPNDKDLAVDVAITSGESPEIYAPMEKRETISNITGSLVNEDEFYYHSTVPGAVVLKMANTTGMRIMTGATSNENKKI